MPEDNRQYLQNSKGKVCLKNIINRQVIIQVQNCNTCILNHEKTQKICSLISSQNEAIQDTNEETFVKKLNGEHQIHVHRVNNRENISQKANQLIH